MKTKLLFLFVIFFGFTIISFSQERQTPSRQSDPIGTIKGKVVDDVTEKPMEYVSIQLLRFRDSSLVSGTLTNSDGMFSINNIPFGRYVLKVKFIGYRTKYVDSLFVTPRNPNVNVGVIHFEPEPIQTMEVEVVAQKDIVTYQIDKRIYNVDKDLNVSGGSAVDVLSNVPSVQVDLDGNVSLRGSGNVTILIDGKPSALLGFDRTAVLEQIPADNIERIEVITNPSAKFDPDGVSGIINIVTKKNLLLGWGSIVNLNAGTADKYNGSLNVNLRTEKINSALGYSYRAFSMRGSSTGSRNSFFPDTSLLYQKQDFLRRGSFQRFSFMFEWKPDNFNSISFNSNLGSFNRKLSDSTGYLLENLQTGFKNDYYRLTSSEVPNLSYDFGLNYKLTFEEPEKELNANLMLMRFGGTDESNYNQTFLGSQQANKLLQRNVNDSKNLNLVGELNYTNPLNFGKLETGVKASLRTLNIDYKFYNYDMISDSFALNTSISNNFEYTENLYSGYLTFSNKINKFGYQIGLRSEFAQTRGEQITTDSAFTKDYFNIFPTLHLSYNINPANTLMFSYTRRVNRPMFMALNPFIDYSDPQNLSQGNPRLHPEYVNSFELSDLQYLPNGSLNLTLFYRYTTDIISRVTKLLDSTTTLTTYENLNKSKSLGFEAILNQNLFNWIKMNLSFSYFYLDVNGLPQYGIPARKSNSWNVKLNTILNITRDLDLQVNLSYDSPVVTTGGGGMYWRFFTMGSLGKIDGIFSANLALKYEIIPEKFTINFRLMDVFKTIRYNLETTGQGFTSYFNRTRESRVAFLGIQYKFNDYKAPRIKRQNELPEIEME